MPVMIPTFTVEAAESVTNHVTGDVRTMIRWRLDSEAESPVVQGDDATFYAVTKIVFADSMTSGPSLSLIGHPVTAKNHRPLTHDRKLPIPIPLADAKTALLSFGGEGGRCLEPVKIVKSAARRTIDDRYFAVQRAGV